jgi:DNA primase
MARGLLKRRPKAEWASIVCPRHQGNTEKNSSLKVSMIDGHFRCHACGVKGGDIVSLHRLITGMGFIDAVRDLGGRFYD